MSYKKYGLIESFVGFVSTERFVSWPSMNLMFIKIPWNVFSLKCLVLEDYLLESSFISKYHFVAKNLSKIFEMICI